MNPIRAADLARFRAQTPSCARRVHLDNAGASPSPEPVLEAMRAHLALEAKVGGYEAADMAKPELDGFYASAARLLGCTPGEIAFMDSATRAWSFAFAAIPFRPGDRILTSQADYASNALAYIQAERRQGATVDVVPNDERGAVDVAALAGMMDARVKLVSISHAPSQSGLLNPAAEIGAVVRRSEALYLLDACQSVGQMPIDVGAIGCHMLSVTGRKFLRGPRGTGFLYVQAATLDRLQPALIDLHSALWTADRDFRWSDGAARFETWEQPLAGKLGLKAAIDYARDIGLERIEQRARTLAERVRRNLADMPGLRLTDPGAQRSAIVTFVPRQKPAAVVQALAERGISSSSIGRGTGRWDFEARGLEAVVRVAPHYFNTEGEADLLCEVLWDLLAKPQRRAK